MLALKAVSIKKQPEIKDTLEDNAVQEVLVWVRVLLEELEVIIQAIMAI